MADISQEIQAFQEAVYGEEVRGSMVSLAEKLNDVSEETEDRVDNFTANINTAINNANTAASNANSKASAANTAANAANAAASTANSKATNASNAATSANQAANAANQAASNATQAEANRAAAETARQNAESARQANEQSRQSAESARVTEENARANSESARASAEAVRQNNESTRQGNESARASAENVRASNEEQRQSTFDRLVAEFPSLTDEQVDTAVTTWLDEHPEATTTVEDGSISTVKLADDAVTMQKLADDVVDEIGSKASKDNVKELNATVFAEASASGIVVELTNCVEITSVDDMADGLTCLGGKNLLPAAPAGEQSRNGITITSDGDGSYTITRTESASSGANIQFELSESVFVPVGANVHVHFLNGAANGNVVLNMFDDNGTSVFSISASPANRIYNATNNLGGKRVKYVGFYASASFTGSLTLSPMIMFSSIESEFMAFGGVSETSGNLPDVPDGELSYIWSNASTATPISVSYITRDGGFGNDVARLDMLGAKKSADGVISNLEHPSYIDSITDPSTGNAFGGAVTVVAGGNLMPKSPARTIESYGVTIESDGDGGYTISGSATAGEAVYIALDDIVTFPDADVPMYLHLRNDGGNGNTSIGIFNSNRARIAEGGPAGTNRVINIASNVKGNNVAYIMIYHSASASYATPLHIRPIITDSLEVTGDETFDGVATSSNGLVPAVPSSSNCRLWALDGTELSVDYTVCADYLEAEIEDLRDSISTIDDTDMLLRNKDVLPWVYASSNYGVNGRGQANYNKQLSMLVLTDVHGCAKQVSNWVEYLNGIDSLDCGINLGDTAAGYYTENDGTWYTGIVNTSQKPIFTLLGNHDVWSPTLEVGSAPTEDLAFQKWIQPTLGIMGVSTTKPYYMKNFDEYGVTLICLNNYGIPNNTSSGGVYKTRRDLDAWSQTHVDWFVSALQSVPSGYHLIVAAHDLPSGNPSVTVQECAWTRVLPTPGVVSGNGSPNVNTMFQDVIDAWINGTLITKTYVPTSYPDLFDAEDFPTLQVNADFSSRGAGIFATFMFGHVHSDTYAKITQYAGQNVVTFASSANDNYQNANTDLPRISDTKMEDCITVLSVDTDNRLVKLVRVGSNKTVNMTDRTVFEYQY